MINRRTYKFQPEINTVGAEAVAFSLQPERGAEILLTNNARDALNV